MCVQPPMQMIPPKTALLIFSPVAFTFHRRFPLSRPYFLFHVFHLLQHNQHIFFFQGNFTRVITCLISEIDHFQGRSIVQSISILQCLERRKLPQCYVGRRLEDWAHPGSKDWIGPCSHFHKQQNVRTY